MYERWLQEEMNWIGAYCSKIRRQALCITAPLILVGSAVLIGALTAFGGGSAADFGYGAFSGFVVGALICGIYLMVLLPALRPKRYGKKIDRCVRGLSLSEGEKEELAREMLEADEGHRISYTITGPGAKGTPGRFVLTPHFAFLEGSYPYAILVRLSDLAVIRRSQEQKTATEHRAKSKTIYRFTLYTIGFYRKDRFQRGLTDKDLPDESFGFFDVHIRERVMELLAGTGIRLE
ncbi:MAG: hypothetical protein HFI29_04130 [Lachnospiraceae bacterium]|jgi:hypothetical protein|nr:hypothetical protein [Lachnospiraceae bacterium]